MENIVKQAKQIICNSEIMLYVAPQKINEAFKNIFLYENKEDFLQAYGKNNYNSGILEGFNRNGKNYIGPDATAHTVIHEVLHGLSSEFDEQGHRIKNGIMGDGSLRFANQVNEGLTDYLAAKLSGEYPRHYMQGHKLFLQLEPMLVKYTKDENVLMQVYMNNDTQFLHKFLNYYGKDNTFENLYENFLFMNDDKIDEMLQNVNKNLNKHLKKRARKEKFNNFINKVKNIFTKKENSTKLLTDGSEHQIDSHQEFVAQYDINNFESTMTQEDIQRYNEYQQRRVEGNQQHSENERYE